jgi:hypothetical protein
MQNQDNNIVIKNLLDCAIQNVRCVADCLSEKEAKMMMECVQLCNDTANMCMQTARMLKSGSKMGLQYLAICEEMCMMCCEECSKHQNMKCCKDCADCCKRCAESCRDKQNILMSK